MRVVSVVGARPQMIKLAPMCDALKKHHHFIVHSGQHYDYDMSDIFFKNLNLPTPDYNLDVGSGSHAIQTAKIMIKLDQVLDDISPDVVLVYGDTNTTVAAALTAKKAGFPVGHIESGCRTWEKYMPEEINRVVTDHLSDFHFCPTETTKTNLITEGFGGSVHQTGDVMYDVLKQYEPHIKPPSYIDQYVFATIHRAENTDYGHNLESIVEGLGESEFPVIFPMHPRTRKLSALYKVKIPEHVKITNPMDYTSTLSHIKHAQFVVTDSGGVQKEAFMLGTPCLTVRKNTEWPETLSLGWNTLTSPKQVKIKIKLVKKPKLYVFNCFGHGDASKKIVKVLGDSV